MINKASVRTSSIDALRGLVMVFMALDHARDFFTASGTDPKDLAHISVGLFLTRWITNLCAPVFLFLAGLGAYLSFSRGKPKSELASFLLKRGIWVLLLECTLLRFGWSFNWNYGTTELQVMWAIGWSMLFLSMAVYLPLGWAAGLASLMVLGHNFFDGVHAEQLGPWGGLWHLLHEPGVWFRISGHEVTILYPLIPWLGVMTLGYAFGSLWLRQAGEHRWRFCRSLSAGLLLCFVVLRALNLYGDPDPWSPQGSFLLTALSFIKINKYPPSLDFLLVTLGVAFGLLALLERISSFQWRPLVTLGRVPMFYYIGHIYLLHFLAVLAAYWHYDGNLPTFDLIFHPPPGYGFPLGAAYAAWIVAVAVLYPFCAWYGELKRRSGHPVLSYF